MNKKGQSFVDLTGSVVQWIVFIVAFTFTVLIVGLVVREFADETLVSADIPDGADNPVIKFAQNYPKYVDWMPLAVYIILIIGSVITASKIPFSKGWIFITVFLTAIFSVVFYISTNFLYMVINIPEFAVQRAQMTIIPIIAQYNGFMCFVYIAITWIACFMGKE